MEIWDWRARSVILCGPFGAGKRTLAALYAQALLCPHSTPSPCGRHGLDEGANLGPERPSCPDCRDLESGEHPNFHKLVAGVDTDNEILAALTRRPASERMSEGHGVLVVVHADRLHDALRNTLDEHLRRVDRRISLILCTENADALDPILRQSIPIISVDPPSISDRRAFLTMLDEAARTKCDPSLLDDIVHTATPSRRALKRDFMELRRLGALTPAGVAAYYHRAVAPVLAYLRTIAVPTVIEAQLSAAEQIPGSWLERVGSIENALAGLFLGDVVSLRDRGGLVRAVPQSERYELVELLTNRGKALGFETRRFWEALVGMFAKPIAATPASFLLMISRCDRFLTDPLAAPPARAASRGRPRTRPPTPSRTTEAPKPRGDQHLRIHEARELWEAASYMVQVHGETFNTRIELHHRPLQLGHGNAVGPFVTRLLHELRQHLRRLAMRRNTSIEPHYAYVHEHTGRDSELGGVTHIILYLPAWVADQDYEPWLRGAWLPRHCLGADIDNGIGVERSNPEIDLLIQHQRHLELLRRLTCGLNRDLPIPGHRAGAAPRLHEALGIAAEKLHPIGSLIGGQRMGVSRAIAKATRSREGKEGLPLPSLWMLKAWSLLVGDYPVEEFRRREIKSVEMKLIQFNSPDRDGVASREKRKALLQRERELWLIDSLARIERCR